MKKSLITLLVLGTAAGSAQAASSVTLYGRADIGYDKSSGMALRQVSAGDVRIGFKGSEDLGNGVSATFHLEGRFDGDSGAKSAGRSFFDRESTVGLKFGDHRVRFGRSQGVFEQSLSDIDVGYRNSAHSVYNETWGVKTRHSNAMFYNYNHGGFSAGADITTKGGLNDGQGSTPAANEGTTGSKVAWGVFAKYKGSNFSVAAAYQDDGVIKAKSIRREWGVSGTYTFNPVTIGASYAQGKDNVIGTQAKLTNYGAYIKAQVTPADALAVMYRREQLKNTVLAGNVSSTERITRYGINYTHALSKRTTIYADVSRTKGRYPYPEDGSTPARDNNKSFMGYDIGVRHYF